MGFSEYCFSGGNKSIITFNAQIKQIENRFDIDNVGYCTTILVVYCVQFWNEMPGPIFFYGINSEIDASFCFPKTEFNYIQ